MVAESQVKALTTRDIADLTGVPISTLNHWVKSKLCKPSVLGPAGNRVTRFWNAHDLIVVMSIRALRSVGCPMQLLKRVDKLVEEQWELTASTASIFYDGYDVYLVDEFDNRPVSGGRSPGQALFPLATQTVAVPVGIWIDSARELGNDCLLYTSDAADE